MTDLFHELALANELSWMNGICIRRSVRAEASEVCILPELRVFPPVWGEGFKHRTAARAGVNDPPKHKT